MEADLGQSLCRRLQRKALSMHRIPPPRLATSRSVGGNLTVGVGASVDGRAPATGVALLLSVGPAVVIATVGPQLRMPFIR